MNKTALRMIWDASWMTNQQKPPENGIAYWTAIWDGLLDRGKELHFRLKGEWQPDPWTRRSESDPLAAQKVIHLEA